MCTGWLIQHFFSYNENLQVQGSIEIVATNLFFYGEGLLAPSQPPSWRTTPCHLSPAAYSIYSQLSSITGSRLSIHNLRTHHTAMTVTHLMWECNETVHQLFIDFSKACDSVRMEVLYNILIEFGVPMKLVRLI
jgi:hypothetical protein